MAQKTTTSIGAPNLIMKKTSYGTSQKGSQRTGWSITYEELDDFEPWLDVVWLVDMLSKPILRHLRESIKRGVHPGTGAPQPKLSKNGSSGHAVAAGIRPDIRGNTTGSRSLLHFFDEVRRAKIKHNGKKVKVATQNKQKIMGYSAVAVIKPHPHHRGWVSQEAARGVEYFDVPDKLIDDALKQYLDKAIKDGPDSDPDTGTKKASQVAKK